MTPSRRTAGAIGLALVVIVAIAGAAATLTAPRTTGNGTAGPGWIPNASGGVAQPGGDALSLPALPWEPLVIGGAALVLLWLVREPRRILAHAIGVLAVVALAWIVISLFADPSSLGGQPGGGAPGVNGSGGGGTGSDASTTSPAPLAIVGIAIVGAGVVAAALLGRRWEGGSGVEEASASEPGSIGAAAGRAADRIEEATSDAGIDNAVYRAWYDMTRLLDVDREASTTPREFEAAATEAGLDATEVGELTRLFERVRYGDDDPSAFEERALAVFRRIEDRYADDAEEQIAGDETKDGNASENVTGDGSETEGSATGDGSETEGSATGDGSETEGSADATGGEGSRGR